MTGRKGGIRQNVVIGHYGQQAVSIFLQFGGQRRNVVLISDK
jgi:hypothetical protein